MSDDKLQDAVNRGARADALLKDEMLQEAFAKLEAEYITAWRQSPARDTDGRERLWQAVQVIGRIKDHLGTVLANGKLAQHEVNRLAEIEQAKSAPRRVR